MMIDDYANIWMHRLKWGYLILIVVTLMSPVLYIMYISFNQYGFGANRYAFTLEWYGLIASDKLLVNALTWTVALSITTTVISVPLSLVAAKYYKATKNIWDWSDTLFLSPLHSLQCQKILMRLQLR